MGFAFIKRLAWVSPVAFLWLGLQPMCQAQISPVAEALPEDNSESIEAFAEEVPEEILRTEIITGARSSLTGKPLSAAEYAMLQAELAAPAGDPLVNSDLRYLVFLAQLRRALKPILPFID
ncbi:MAG: hypothetical protein WA885_04050 [Phormidesmis sp.]